MRYIKKISQFLKAVTKLELLDALNTKPIAVNVKSPRSKILMELEAGGGHVTVLSFAIFLWDSFGF